VGLFEVKYAKGRLPRDVLNSRARVPESFREAFEELLGLSEAKGAITSSEKDIEDGGFYDACEMQVI